MKTSPLHALPLETRLRATRLLARLSLGFVWLYEGLVPKILFPHLHPEQSALVASSGLMWRSPEATLVALGLAQAILGLMLLAGWCARAAALIATGFMAVLIVLVAAGRPEMLTDPFGALAKDACLVACAAILWLLPPEPNR